MRVERRGRIVWVCLVVNRCCRDEPGEWAEVVRDIEARGLAGLSTGQGQQGCGGCGWAVNPGVRAGPEKESVQTVESALVRQLFPAAGTVGGNTEVRRKRVRILGVPTVADRIAQTVVAMYLEPGVETVFHPDSYGYRPGRSALDAVGVCRERCWSTNWVIDLDIQGFFDNLDHELVLRAVAHHTDLPWVLLYVQRWLT